MVKTIFKSVDEWPSYMFWFVFVVFWGFLIWWYDIRHF